MTEKSNQPIQPPPPAQAGEPISGSCGELAAQAEAPKKDEQK